jgi:ABC-type dipeptide/oligopeptide/nickel transport system permease component
MRYLARRLLLAIPVLIGVTLLSFSLLRLVPGDPAEVLAGEEATAEQVAHIRHEYGLDRPIMVQYVIFLRHVATGDLGISYRNRTPVTELLVERFAFTLQLAVLSIVVATVLGVVIGVFAATRQGSALDTLSMLGALAGISTPVFWLGLIGILVFSVQLRILPAGGSGSLVHLVMPSLVLGAGSAAMMARLTRGVMLEVLGQDYIRTARASGLTEGKVLFVHALRNALLPVLTVFGLQFGNMLGGAVLTESVFALPGMGRLVVDSIFARDYPVVQGGILLAATTFVLVNLVTDVLYTVLDPRIRCS